VKGHIAGARYAHLDGDLAAPVGMHDGRHPLPDPARFAQTLGNWGIDNSSTVVVYDDVSGAIAARLWWLLRWLGHKHVSVLDGGLDAWLAHGQGLESALPTWDKSIFSPAPTHDQWIVRSVELLQLMESGALLLDARSADRFHGISEPIDPVAGHVPGARNLPFSSLVATDKTLLPPQQLSESISSLLDGRDAEDVIAMCGSGVTACHLLLAMSAAGLGDGRLYAGSWSEWIRDTDREIATGPN
jgi:thiosulfate/3-mercaptopyruvate sulfurtransferase